MNHISNQFSSIEQLTDRYLKKENSIAITGEPEISFEEILKQKQTTGQSLELKFSKHASMRLQNRNIALSQNQQERLESGAEKAKAKGMKDSLVIVDSYSFIVNVPSKTVVTAMDQKESEENIYTNIDGAVIM
ncbi:MAG: TIGR02530 family flagellar biosynthesis protein [Lachnospiraceae bacterium]